MAQGVGLILFNLLHCYDSENYLTEVDHEDYLENVFKPEAEALARTCSVKKVFLEIFQS